MTVPWLTSLAGMNPFEQPDGTGFESCAVVMTEPDPLLWGHPARPERWRLHRVTEHVRGGGSCHVLRRHDGAELYLTVLLDSTGSLDDRGIRQAFDKANPLPEPPPIAGQVWAFDGGKFTQLVTAAEEIEPGRWRVVMGSGGYSKFGKGELTPWPVPGGVLVAGAFSPWVPSDG